MKHSLRRSANLSAWARQHPWLLMGAAITGGFTAGLLAVRRTPPGHVEMPAQRHGSSLLSLAGTMFSSAIQSILQSTVVAAILKSADQGRESSNLPNSEPMPAVAQECESFDLDGDYD